MPITRRLAIASGAAFAASPVVAAGSPEAEIRALWGMTVGRGAEFVASMGYFFENGDRQSAPGLIFAMRYSDQPEAVLAKLLTDITGEDPGKTWRDWMLWQEAHPEVTPNAAYAPFKRALLLRVDPDFAVFLQPEYLQPGHSRIRFEEVTWGGVGKDGIPSLDRPHMIAAGDADYLADDDLVFGVSINGDHRAYPLRILGWHEMFNDVIGGVPVALAYCTLCGAGILFETLLENEREPFIFGSSGFLYRSNKLMFDRGTHSLWNQFTGMPVMGPLAQSGIALKQRPVVIESWASWRATSPKTQVLSQNTGFLRDYGSGVVYKDYFASPDLMFPARVDQSRLRQKDFVFGLQAFGAAKAWPLDAFEGGRVINDQVGSQPVVLVGDAGTRSVRAFARGEELFEAVQPGQLLSQGRGWRITETELKSETGKTLPRLAGRVAYWFAWDGYFGDVAELYAE